MRRCKKNYILAVKTRVTGALTSSSYSFKARPWEVRTFESIDFSDGLASSLYISLKETEIVRVYPKINYGTDTSLISDKARFSFDGNKNNRLFNNVLDNVILTKKKLFLF